MQASKIQRLLQNVQFIVSVSNFGRKVEVIPEAFKLFYDDVILEQPWTKRGRANRRHVLLKRHIFGGHLKTNRSVTPRWRSAPQILGNFKQSIFPEQRTLKTPEHPECQTEWHADIAFLDTITADILYCWFIIPMFPMPQAKSNQWWRQPCCRRPGWQTQLKLLFALSIAFPLMP